MLDSLVEVIRFIFTKNNLKINNYKTKKYTDIKNTTSLEYIFFYFH